MRKINKPNFGISEILDCIKKYESNYQKKSKDVTAFNKKVEEALLSDEVKYMIEYDNLIDYKTSDLDVDEAKKIFEKYDDYNRKATLKNKRYQLYELADGRCPICDTNFGYSQINLDHILPKSEYLSLAITPINLVSTCNCCNMKKNNRKADKIFSPYFHEYDLTKLLTAKLINGGDFNNVLVKICVKEFDDLKRESNIASKVQLNEIKKNINIYGLLGKYSSIASVFVYETIKFYSNIQSLTTRTLLFSKRWVRDLLTEQDIWVDTETSGGNKYCDEAFIKHLSIEAMKEDGDFLEALVKLLTGNIDMKKLFSEQMQEAIKLIKEKKSCNYSVNCNALIKRVLRGSDLVAYYEVKTERDEIFLCRLLDFQGAYQNNEQVMKFIVNEEWKYFNIAIESKKIQLCSNEQTLEKFTFCKNNVGIELVIPIISNTKCMGIVYIGIEGELGNCFIDKEITEEFHNALNELYCKKR